MSIDMSQFLQTFYEESFEGLEVMETELLNLDVGAADSETINTIFRAAHSIGQAWRFWRRLNPPQPDRLSG